MQRAESDSDAPRLKQANGGEGGGEKGDGGMNERTGLPPSKEGGGGGFGFSLRGRSNWAARSLFI